MKWANAESKVTRLIGGVAHSNIASQRVLLKNGFVKETQAEEVEELMFVLNVI